jgi:hypothetical protein
METTSQLNHRIVWWLSRDPIGERGGLNLYGYANNDPVNETDPDGRFAIAVPAILAGGGTTGSAGGIIGALGLPEAGAAGAILGAGFGYYELGGVIGGTLADWMYPLTQSQAKGKTEPKTITAAPLGPNVKKETMCQKIGKSQVGGPGGGPGCGYWGLYKCPDSPAGAVYQSLEVFDEDAIPPELPKSELSLRGNYYQK